MGRERVGGKDRMARRNERLKERLADRRDRPERAKPLKAIVSVDKRQMAALQSSMEAEQAVMQAALDKYLATSIGRMPPSWSQRKPLVKWLSGGWHVEVTTELEDRAAQQNEILIAFRRKALDSLTVESETI